MDSMSNTPPEEATDMTLAPVTSPIEKIDLSSVDDDTLVVRLMDPLLKLAWPAVKHYHTDVIRDAQTITAVLVPWVRNIARHGVVATPFPWTRTWYYSADECGTWLSEDQDLGWRRTRVQALVTIEVSKDRWNEWVLTLTVEVQP
jgi:hypothetical protein